jgi:hypothetical protein
MTEAGKAATEGEHEGMNTGTEAGTAHLTGTAATMELLTGYFGNRLGRLVVDKTGLVAARFNARLGAGRKVGFARATADYGVAEPTGPEAGVAKEPHRSTGNR